MNAVTRFVTQVHAWLVWLYPHGFRLEFGEEMRTVFADAVAEAAGRGGTSLVALCLREVWDWPRVLLSEHWVSIKAWCGSAMTRQADDDGAALMGATNGRYKMSEARGYKEWGMDDRRQAIAAALPPLLFGLGVVVASLVGGGPWYAVPRWRLFLGVALGLIPAAGIAGGGLLALVRRLPDWGYTWTGAALMGLLLLVKTMAEELAEEGRFLVSPLEGPVAGVLILLVLMAVLGLAAWRGWPQAGLVSLGLSTIMGLSLCQAVRAGPFFRDDLALLAGPLGLLFAALIYAYARGSSPARVGILVGLWLVNAGLVWMADQVWQSWLLARGKPSPAWPLLVLLTGLLLSGPVLGLLGWPLRRALRRV